MNPDAPDGLLTVGLMSRRSGLTAKALRHYDRVGLLRPAAVDATTGYRRYHPNQIAEAQLVQLLRSLDLPIEQVRIGIDAWKQGDQPTIERLLTAHRRRLDARVTRLRGALHRIDHLLKEGLAQAMSETEQAPPTNSATSTIPTAPTPISTPAPATAATAPTSAPTSAQTPTPESDPSPPTAMSAPGTGTITNERMLAAQLFNEAWRLMEQENRTTPDDDRMIHIAHASRYHWGQVPTATPANLARGEWQVSRVYAVLHRAEPALHHARRVLEICEENKIGDWDLGFAYEAIARAYAVAGDEQQARAYTDQALAAAEEIAEDGEREMLLADLETIPGQPRYW
jgi:DNA-binding transcriptional MerR regulator